MCAVFRFPVRQAIGAVGVKETGGLAYDFSISALSDPVLSTTPKLDPAPPLSSSPFRKSR